MVQLSKGFITYTLLIVGSTAAIFFTNLILKGKWNQKVFSFQQVSNFTQKLQILRELGLFIAVYLMLAAFSIMTMRILTGKAKPSQQTDNKFVNFLNRIITNTIEQSFIFFGLYLYVLFETEMISPNKLVALAVLFIVGRLLFAVGYFIATLTSISTFRSPGFAMTVFANIYMVDCIFFAGQYVSKILG